MERVGNLVKIIQGNHALLTSAFIDDALKNRIHIFYLRGAGIHTKSDFLNESERVMQFPEYFGKNWDAFEECINDLSWLPADGYILVYDRNSDFFDNNPDDGEILVSILKTARENWKSEGIPFEFLLFPD